MFRRFLCMLLIFCLAAGTACADVYQMKDKWPRITKYQVEKALKSIEELPAGSVVSLDGVSINATEIAKLMTGRPDLTFQCQIPFGKAKVPQDTVDFNLDSMKPGKVGATQLLNGFTCLPHLEHVVMYNQPITVKDMEKILAAKPDTDFEWTVRIDSYKIRTDVTAFSTMKGRQDPRYTSKQMEPLKYCENLQAIDLGHNNVNDLSFLTNWPDLKVIIIIDSKKRITDLTPLTNLDQLEYVEMFMQNITDLTPLANKPNLKDLNLCHNNITDLTPLYGNQALERLWIHSNPNLTQDQIDAFKAAVPGCQVISEGYQSTGFGWRDHPRYATILKMFETRTYIPFDQ
ncbi:MAG: leucine-rich repeat domain-containing protein [Clostridia bacterium]|nr:leucine-rich repeat domain-containing protein [Clostridia bacterium]